MLSFRYIHSEGKKELPGLENKKKFKQIKWWTPWCTENYGSKHWWCSSKRGTNFRYVCKLQGVLVRVVFSYQWELKIERHEFVLISICFHCLADYCFQDWIKLFLGYCTEKCIKLSIIEKQVSNFGPNITQIYVFYKIIYKFIMWSISEIKFHEFNSFFLPCTIFLMVERLWNMSLFYLDSRRCMYCHASACMLNECEEDWNISLLITRCLY